MEHGLSQCVLCRGAHDRLTHHAEIIPIEGESYRLREAELAQQARRAPAEGDDRKRPSKA
jgi:IstB-like ATP binding protein